MMKENMLQGRDCMQARMKKYGISRNEIDTFLDSVLVGRLSTCNEDGYPYTVPVHFVYEDGKIYIHGLPQGKKLDNLKANDKVCFEADQMISLIEDGVEAPCDINTEYISVIAFGKAGLLTEVTQKCQILNKVVQKYTPRLQGRPLPENMVKGTAIIEIEIMEITGKHYQ